jgi:hypothetical protein
VVSATLVTVRWIVLPPGTDDTPIDGTLRSVAMVGTPMLSREGAGGLGFREHLGPLVAEEPEVLQEPRVVDQTGVEGRAGSRRRTGVNVARTHVEGVGEADAVVVADVDGRRGHERRLGRRRGPLRVHLLEQGEQSGNLRAGHRRPRDLRRPRGRRRPRDRLEEVAPGSA